jgi:hypothetical protein
MTDIQVPRDLARRLSFCAVVPLDKTSTTRQAADSVLLVTPKFFRRNAQTAIDNTFMPEEDRFELEEVRFCALGCNGALVKRLWFIFEASLRRFPRKPSLSTSSSSSVFVLPMSRLSLLMPKMTR